MKAHQKPFKGETHIWLTPPDLLAALGKFDLDPCAAPSPRPWPTATRHIELPEDGLAAEWFGRVWLNPPFDGNLRPLWMRKMSEHGDGIMLIPAAVETRPFQDFVWAKASSILFMAKRPNYHYPDGARSKANSGSPMCLVAYGVRNCIALENSGLGFYTEDWRPSRVAA
jgi:hypothetical protein